MAARLTDKQKKKIIADYVQLGSYNAVAKINKVSDKTVKKIVTANPNIQKQYEDKKLENTQDILSYMESKKNIVCEILGKGLEVLNDKEKMKEAPLNQITTALGTLIDKWVMVSSDPMDVEEEDSLSKSLREMAEGLESDDQ